MRRNSHGGWRRACECLVGNRRTGPPEDRLRSVPSWHSFCACRSRRARARPRIAAHSTTVPPSLVAAALAHPQQMFDVIIQSAGGADSADVARTVRGTVALARREAPVPRAPLGLGVGHRRRPASSREAARRSTRSRPTAAVTSTVKNPQKWPGATGHRLVLGLAVREVLDRGDDRDRRLRHRQLQQASSATACSRRSTSRPPGSSTRPDGRGHGTFVAGVAASAGRYGGAAPDANLVSLKVFDDLGRRHDERRPARGRLDPAEQGSSTTFASRTSRFRPALATSFRFDPLDRALEQLWQSGVVVVVAAGNYAVDGAPSGVLFSPANDPFVITVGALDVERRHGHRTTTSTHRGRRTATRSTGSRSRSSALPAGT